MSDFHGNWDQIRLAIARCDGPSVSGSGAARGETPAAGRARLG
jgi:hypothetical protein